MAEDVPKPLHIVLAGGGTGGHIYPLLAIAEELKKHSTVVDISYVGLRGGPEEKLVAEAKLPFFRLDAPKLNRFWTIKNLGVGCQLLSAISQAGQILKQLRPNFVICKGGYVSLPVALCCALRGIPYVVHESDAQLGLANRLSARFAQYIYTGFPVEFYPAGLRSKMRFVGIPVFGELGERSAQPDPPTVLVIGGSQGAHRLNELVQPLLPKLLEQANVIHLTGSLDFPIYQALAKKLPAGPFRYKPYAELPHDKLLALYKHLTLAISRAGSGGNELLLAGVPTVFLPLSSSAGNHQAENARYWLSRQAAFSFDERLVTSDMLWQFLEHLLKDDKKLAALSERAKTVMPRDAAHVMVEEILGASNQNE